MVGNMVMKRETPRPTEGELELLSILWKSGPATVREIFEAVNVRRDVVYTGVLKLLQIMTEKGLVQRDERERAHVYSAAVSQDETEVRFLRELSDRFFAGSAARLALRALEMEKADDGELDEIRKLIARKDEQAAEAQPGGRQ
jgi:predicted transcriptional regulator